MKPQLNRFLVLLNAERKKLGVLGVLMLALVAAGVRAVVLSGPRSASAAVRAGADGEREGEGSGGTGSSASGGTRRPDIQAPIPADLKRDLFAINEEHFPRPAQTEPADAVAPKSAPAKVETPSRVEPPRQEDPPEARAAEDLRKLRLKGTILGGTPMAVIELTGQRDKRSSVVRPGEQIEGFTLIEVKSGGVVLEKYGIKLELKRALPEG